MWNFIWKKIDCFSKGLCAADTRASSLASNSDLCNVTLSWVGFLFTVAGTLASTNWNNFAFNIQSHRVICCDAGTVSLLKKKSYIQKNTGAETQKIVQKMLGVNPAPGFCDIQPFQR